MARAKRIAFLSVNSWEIGTPAFQEIAVEFDWSLGQNFTHRQTSYRSLHEELRKLGYTPLEISTKSEEYEFGKKMSAFNLKLKGFSVENIFQAYKVFNDGGPYLNLLNLEASKVKNTCSILTAESKKGCITNSVEYHNKEFFLRDDICHYCKTRGQRKLISFSNGTKSWPIFPRSFFFDLIYLSALLDNSELAGTLIKFNAFTDIEFNQKEVYSIDKGPFNCQARACAIYSTLINSGLSNQDILALLDSPSELEKLYPRSKLLKDEDIQIKFEI